jgi:hypothetical protein
MLALVLAASNAFAAIPSADDPISDGEEFIPACYTPGVPFEPQCWFGDVLN